MRNAAFMLTREDGFSRGDVRVYTQNLPGGRDSGSRERAMIQGVWQYAGLGNGFDWGGQHYTSLWPALANQAASRGDVEEYLEERLFGCGDHDEDRRHLSDRPTL